MKLAIVVPVKSPRRAKHRLAPLLTEPDRERLAATMARNPKRRLVYAAPFDTYVTHPEPLLAPLFLDHTGNRQALLGACPTGRSKGSAVALSRPLASPLGVW